ncbi:hypothetical protein LEN26_001496 [Aphanomyces euteiches]|nr:hypothetical protein AeMF1_014654 [Aphanomyces euteiches]KAH9161281.1 hypothetical protein LEN26_001496 [Aphanomyces euteiches]KAH9184040.1 hypothetical protein AeNC1_013985 [Aphanomyces euteiches]
MKDEGERAADQFQSVHAKPFLAVALRCLINYFVSHCKKQSWSMQMELWRFHLEGLYHSLCSNCSSSTNLQAMRDEALVVTQEREILELEWEKCKDEKERQLQARMHKMKSAIQDLRSQLESLKASYHDLSARPLAPLDKSLRPFDTQ